MYKKKIILSLPEKKRTSDEQQQITVWKTKNNLLASKGIKMAQMSLINWSSVSVSTSIWSENLKLWEFAGLEVCVSTMPRRKDISNDLREAIIPFIQRTNARPSVLQVHLGWKWVTEQENNPKHISNAAIVVDLPVHKQMSVKLNELKQCCEEGWAKIPPQRCERLVMSYRKGFLQANICKGGSTRYWMVGWT